MSPRRYDSTRRRQAAQQTHEDIVRAALRLHWEGITEFSAIAGEAGCSEATVRKHFPTKEHLYEDCTRSFAETLVLPDLEALAAVTDPERRLEECVGELCRIHETMFGFVWLMIRQGDASPTLAAEMQGYEGLVQAMAEILAPRQSKNHGAVRSFLDALTYRALRLSGGLSPEETRAQLIDTLRPVVLDEAPTSKTHPSLKGPNP